MGERVRVDAGLGDRHRVRARRGGQHERFVEERRGGRGLRELRGELAEGQVLTALLNESERRDVPEHGGSAVAEHHLVAVGEGEEFGQSVAQSTHHRLDGVLAMAGAEVVATHGRERGDGLGANLRRAAAESAVGGEEVGGDLDRRHGCHPLTPPPGSVPTSGGRMARRDETTTVIVGGGG